MIETVKIIGGGICFVVGGFGICFAVYGCISYLFDYFIRKWKGYKLIIDYALNHKQFHEWKKRNTG